MWAFSGASDLVWLMVLMLCSATLGEGALKTNSVTYQLTLLVCLEFDLEFYPPQFRCLNSRILLH